jgi:hypothetical protein
LYQRTSSVLNSMDIYQADARCIKTLAICHLHLDFRLENMEKKDRVRVYPLFKTSIQNIISFLFLVHRTNIFIAQLNTLLFIHYSRHL